MTIESAVRIEDDEEEAAPPISIGHNPARLFDVFDEITNLRRIEGRLDGQDQEEVYREAGWRRQYLENYALTLKPDDSDIADMLVLVHSRLDGLQSEIELNPSQEAEVTLIKRAVAGCFHAMRDSVKGNGGILNEFYGLPETWAVSAEKAIDDLHTNQSVTVVAGVTS